MMFFLQYNRSGKSPFPFKNKLHFHKFLVLDLPTHEHVEMFSSCINSIDLLDLDLIIHFSPSSILTDERYKALFDSPKFYHAHNIYLNEEEKTIALFYIAKL